MASISEQVLQLIGGVQSFNDQANLLLAAVGQGQLDPEQIQAQIQAATQASINAVLAQLDGYDATTILQRQDMLKMAEDIRNTNGDDKYFFEFYRTPYLFADEIEIADVATVAGDESVDCADTSQLEVGREYVICSGTSREAVTVDAVLTGTRFRAASEVSATYSGATLKRTSAQMNGRATRFAPGDIYYGGSFTLGHEEVDKALLIRRAPVGELSVYFQDDTRSDWTVAPWEWERTNRDETKDVEYRLPARGDFKVKIVNESDVDVVAEYVVGIHQGTGLRGEHRPPDTPTMVSPVDGATEVGEQAALTTSAWSHPAGSAQLGTEFQVSLQDGEDFVDGLVYASPSVPGVSLTLEAGLLTTGTVYYARARTADEFGTLSDWSETVSFTTKSSFVQVVAPRCLAPAAGATLESPIGLTLESSDWETTGTGTDTHVFTNWQIATSPDFAAESLLVDVEEDAVNLTSLDIADGTVEYGGQYYWRCCHVGAAEGASDWSPSCAFSVQALANGVRVEGGVCIGPFTRADGTTGFFVVPPWQNRSKIWGLSSLDVPGLNNVTPDGSGENHTGEYNTAHLVANYASYVDNYGKVGPQAAAFCAGFEFEGHDDYFLPTLPEWLFILARAAYLTQGYGSSTLASCLTNNRIWTSSEYDSVGACITNGTNGATAIKRDGDGYYSFIYAQPVRFLVTSA